MAKWKKYFGSSIVGGFKNAMGVDRIQENFSDMKSDLNHLIESAKGNIQVEHKNMTFDEMVEKFNLDEDKLKNQYKNYYWTFYLMGLMTILAILLSVYYGMSGKIMPCITAFIISGVPLAKMFESSINCFRIKQKHFHTVKEWHQAKAYIPSKI